MRLRGILRAGLMAPVCAAILAAAAFARMPAHPHPDDPRSQGQTADRGAQARPEASTTSEYEGLKVEQIGFPGVPPSDQQQFYDLIPLKVGQPLDRESIRQSIEKLYASGRFVDIRAEADKIAGGGVRVNFVTSPAFFIGRVEVLGAPGHPSANQLANASKLELGEPLTQEKLDRAVDGIKQLLEENGYYRASIREEETKHPLVQQSGIVFRLAPGPQAHVGQVLVTGNPGYSTGAIEDIAKLHPGDKVSSQRISNALDRLRKKYQKHNRWLADVTVAARTYQPSTNAVDYTFSIDPGPVVRIVTEGFHISSSVLKRNVPVYQEDALDDDLLNEGRRNLLNYLQTRGYFDAKVTVHKTGTNASGEMHVVYDINAGARHKLVKVSVQGSHYFSEELLRSHMQVQPAGRVLSHGRYSQGLLNDDIQGLKSLYEANGFQQVKIDSNVADNYQGQENQLAVTLRIEEGPQTRVETLHLVGNQTFTTSQLAPYLNTAEGQPFSEANIAQDRDTLLNYYFNRGFPNATFEASAKPAPGQPNRMNVTFTIHEGQRVFVDQVLVSGLEYTKPFVLDRELQMKPGDPLSQIDMLDTQRRLYDLGIFSQVDTAVQNPDGVEQKKNVLVQVQEAKRYTFDYGVGLEFQTGQPQVGSNVPQGATGVSPRVSFGVTRINFRGRDHTISFNAHVGRLQQRGLVSYDIPHWLNSPKWRLSLTTFYDDTVDVTTFTSERLEGSVQAEQSISKASTMDYRFTYRRVLAANLPQNLSQVPLLSLPTRVGGPGFTYIRDKRDNALESTKGNYNTVDAFVASSQFGSEADFSRVLLQNSSYYAFGKNRVQGKQFVFARSTRIGIETPFGNSVLRAPGECPAAGSPEQCLPLPELFFSGGGNSHRGFGLNQAGPRDPGTGYPLGGGALFLNNLELRFPPVTLPFFQDNLSFAIFHDAGNVFTNGQDMLHSLLRWHQRDPQLCLQQSTHTLCDYNYISHAIGVGVRYKTPIGPVRFDFGYNLNPPAYPSSQTVTLPSGQQGTVFVPQHLGHFNVFLSIGQTF